MALFGIDAYNFPCGECGKTLPTERGLWKHTKKAHPGQLGKRGNTATAAPVRASRGRNWRDLSGAAIAPPRPGK